MRYRALGKTGLKVSEIAFGTYGFSNPGLLSAALDRGVNLICTCADYQDGRAEEAIGKALSALGGRRDRIVLLTGTTIRPGDSRERILRTIDESLRKLRTDRIEIFKTHSVDDPRQLRIEVLFEAFEEARQAGKVRHLGFSGHGRRLVECLETAVSLGHFETIQCRYDFVSYRDSQARIFRQAVQKGIGNLVFKISAGEKQDEIQGLQSGGLSFRQATVKWALSNPDVSSVCAGITNFDQIEEYCGAVGREPQQAEIRMLERYASSVFHEYCRNCGICEDSCPHRVAVADVMRYAMYFQSYRREKDAMRLYARLPAESTAAPCSDCGGHCRGACPYGRDIREGLLQAHVMLT